MRLPGILKEYIRKYSRVDIAIETVTPVELTEKVLDHSLDGTFIAGPAHHPHLNAMQAFATLIGSISLELFGHWHNTVLVPELLFDETVAQIREAGPSSPIPGHFEPKVPVPSGPIDKW